MSAEAGRAVVFDLDGTLIDSAPAIRDVGNACLAEIGLAPLSLAETRSFIGRGARVFLERALDARGTVLENAAFEARHDRFQALYAEAPGEANTPYPHAEAVLRALRADGVAIGLCTNKPGPPTHAVLGALGWSELFGVVIAGDDLPVKKPDPAPLRAAFKALGAESGLFVGDSESDEGAALGAGAPFGFYTSGYRKKPVDAFTATFAFDDWRDFRALAAL